MKTKINIEHAILGALILCLIVQAFNTGSLYSHTSNLGDILRAIAGVFVGIGFEAAIFICVVAGSKWAGRVFAVFSLIVGLLFHNDFDDLRNIDFWYTKHFISTTIMQVICNLLSLFLSELYVSRKNERLSGLITEESVLRDEIKKLNEQLSTLQKTISNKHQQEKEYTDLLSTLDKKINSLRKVESELEQTIDSLKKKKATASRGQKEDSDSTEKYIRA